MNNKIQLEHDRFGCPGIDNYIIIEDVLKDDKRRDEDRFKDDSLREFEVIGSLARFLPFTEDIKCSVAEGEGTSYFLMTEGSEKAKVSTPFGNYHLQPNGRGELATIRHVSSFSTWQAAIGNFISGISPFLDRLSFVANVPVVFERVHCRDRKNDLHIVSYKTPYSPITINPHEGQIQKPLLAVYALYREAKNSSSNYYKFLCYYKILEGIFRELRPNLMSKAHEQHISITTRKEVVPRHDELVRFNSQYIGRSIPEFFDKELTHKYRDAVAHFSLKDGRFLFTSDYNWASMFAQIVLVVEICTREVIKTQELYYEEFLAGGGKL